MHSLLSLIRSRSLILTWLIAMVGVFGFFVAEYIFLLPPCFLCWWQRVALVPIAALTTIALLMGEKSTFLTRSLLTFSLGGFAVALYHSLLYYGILAPDLAPCDASGVSCLTELPAIAGINLILASLAAFAMISLLQIIAYKRT